jgi:phosphatidate cytidylyltransferase
MEAITLDRLKEVLSPLLSDSSYLFSFGLLAALLLAAQSFNSLRLRAASATQTHHKVKIIISSWWKIMLGVFFAFWGGSYTAIPVFYLLSLYAVREYVGVSALKDFSAPLLIGSALGITLHYASFVLHDTFLFFSSIEIYTLAIVLPFLVFTPRLSRLPELLAFYLGVMLMAVFLSFPVAVLRFQSDILGSEENARLAVLLLIVLTEVNDILQFICGKLFGRHKVIPAISPNKTEAGFIGGAFFSTLLAFFLWPHFIPVTPAQAALLGLLLSLAGMLGDLVCSAIKRYRGVKDFSDLIPGHGGVLDRIDSLLVTSPVFFFFLYFLNRGNG